MTKTIKELAEEALSANGIDPGAVPPWFDVFCRNFYRLIASPRGDRTITMENRFFTSHNGSVYDENSDFDVLLKIDGDFVDDQKKQYAEMIAEALNDYNWRRA